MVGHGPPQPHSAPLTGCPSRSLLPDPDLLDVRHQQTLGLLLLLRPAGRGLLLLSFYYRLQVRALRPGRDLGGSGEGGEARL